MAISDAGAPSRGPANAPVSIVEFTDYQCPFCARAVTTLKKVEETYRGKVRIVVRDFPLPGHAEAPRAAEAAACADQQGKFWELHDRLFALGAEQVETAATEAGLDIQRFTACMKSGEFARKWRRDQEDGIRYGIGGTPTVFVNGRMVSGAVLYEVLADIIEDELSRSTENQQQTRR